MGDPVARPPIDWDEYLKFIDDFKAESDRAAVILGVAKLDLLLFQILQRVLSPCPTGNDELLDGDAPLSTYSARINLVHRLGIIDSSFGKALHMTRKIRNAFAHEVAECSLNSPPHRDRVSELTAPLGSGAAVQAFRSQHFGSATGPSVDFRVALAMMVALLEVLRDHVKPLKSEVCMPYAPEAFKKK